MPHCYMDTTGIYDTPYIIDKNRDNYPLVNAIPDFPSWTIILPLVIAAMLVAVVYRKRLTK